MKIKVLAALMSVAAAALSSPSIASDQNLPVSYQDVFDSSMGNPAVMIYFGDKAFARKDYVESLRWMLGAAEYNHEAAIDNVKFMIKNNLGTYENRDRVISFLSYYAEPKGNRNPDAFAQIYLADYYRGDSCVWFAPGEKSDCRQDEFGKSPSSSSDLKLSYYYYDGAARQGDVRSQYSSAMMTVLGLGVPRNVPEGVSSLKAVAERGNPHVAYIVGEIYQQGYWMPQDRREATKWFALSANSDLPVAKMAYAKNLEAGVLRDLDERTRISRAVALYSSVANSIISNQAQRSEALYRLGLLHANHGILKDDNLAKEYMSKAASVDRSRANEHSAMALMWKGDKVAESDLRKAVSLYEEASQQLETLPLDVQQRHAIVWQKIAYAYARGGDSNLRRDERRFSDFMNKHHEVLSQTFVPQSNHSVFAGYSAFQFPG